MSYGLVFSVVVERFDHRIMVEGYIADFLITMLRVL